MPVLLRDHSKMRSKLEKRRKEAFHAKVSHISMMLQHLQISASSSPQRTSTRVLSDPFVQLSERSLGRTCHGPPERTSRVSFTTRVKTLIFVHKRAVIFLTSKSVHEIKCAFRESLWASSC